MGKIRFLIDPNTFWMILGTSKFLRFLGPVVDPGTPHFSWIYLKDTRQNQGSSWEKYDLWKGENWNVRNFRNSGNLRCPLFEFLKFRIPDFLIIRNDEFLKWWTVEDEESPDINFAGGICWKAWIWISFRSKGMKRFCGKANQLFYFQAM